MQQVTPNVYVENGLGPCNLGLVTTKEGTVMIDSPWSPSAAIKWRDEAGKLGKPQYVINTEEHPDHYQTTWFLPGKLVSSQETRDKLSKVSATEVIERIKHTAPESMPHMESYQVRLADISFAGSLDLYLGDHSFKLFPLPGHTAGGIGVYIPEERVVFTTDCVFCHVKTWLQDADPEQWLQSLKRIASLDAEIIVPGHGAPCKKDYVKEQTGIIQQWVEVVKSAIKQGLSQEQAIARISPPDPYPMQAGISYLNTDQLNKMIIARLYHLYSK